MRAILTLMAGLLFGLGLIVANMINPQKVLGFLDLMGAWDPSLALVMLGALAVGVPVFAWATHTPHSWCGTAIEWPQNTQITRRLVLGSVAFGAGWGLVGLCPAPALVAAMTGHPSVLIFVAAMLAGFGLFALLDRPKAR
ncbi:MAG: hypothetical protein RLY58_429 [Pseudomonadota bacterium]|jgi:uncharacterized membrane protein YedE/YeeE